MRYIRISCAEKHRKKVFEKVLGTIHGNENFDFLLFLTDLPNGNRPGWGPKMHFERKALMSRFIHKGAVFFSFCKFYFCPATIPLTQFFDRFCPQKKSLVGRTRHDYRLIKGNLMEEINNFKS